MSIRVAFAGDRQIAVSSLEYLLERGIEPVALLLPKLGSSSHDAQLASLCAYLPDRVIHRGPVMNEDFLRALQDLDVDLLLSVHYPHIVREPLLSTPRVGCLNLHPAYLPYNRGWHTASWAILDDTPIGATLHFMEPGLDAGDIVLQKELNVLPSDTAHTLYQRLLRLELDVLMEAWPAVESGEIPRRPQEGLGTSHKHGDLLRSEIQHLEMEDPTTVSEVLRRLRALTTNRVTEGAYIVVDGQRFYVQVQISPGEILD